MAQDTELFAEQLFVCELFRSSVLDHATDELCKLYQRELQEDFLFWAASQHRLEGLIGPTLSALLPEWNQKFPKLEKQVRAAIECISMGNDILLEKAHSLMATLRATGIPCDTLKGAWLLEHVYPHSGYRRMSDIDLWISPKNLSKVQSILATHSFTRLDTPYNTCGRSFEDTMLAFKGREAFFAHRLHIDVHWLPVYFVDTQFCRLNLQKAYNESTERLTPIAQLLMLVIHTLAAKRSSLHSMFDIYGTLDTYGIHKDELYRAEREIVGSELCPVLFSAIDSYVEGENKYQLAFGETPLSEQLFSTSTLKRHFCHARELFKGIGARDFVLLAYSTARSRLS